MCSGIDALGMEEEIEHIRQVGGLPHPVIVPFLRYSLAPTSVRRSASDLRARSQLLLKMMQVKDILALKHLKPRPPVLVIDETTIKCSDDTGPVCGCDEKYSQIKHYKPFLPGAVNPYNRRQIPGSEDLDILWRQVKIGSSGLAFEKPVAVHQSELLGDSVPRITMEDPEDNMFVRQPKYSEEYLMQKLSQCKREHSEGCNCRSK